MEDTIFDKLLRGEIKSWKVWENERFLAFLTPFPNTPGLTIVIPKRNAGDYIFRLEEDDYTELLAATRVVAKILERAFDTPRIALVFEGTGVAYVHAKLLPLHGDLASQTNVWSPHTEFTSTYLGYLTTAEGPKMPDEELDKIQQKILEAQEQS
jgi:diadenosine tetraphosphate (Ap4A) HIT family hydrolase